MLAIPSMSLWRIILAGDIAVAAAAVTAIPYIITGEWMEAEVQQLRGKGIWSPMEPGFKGIAMTSMMTVILEEEGEQIYQGQEARRLSRMEEMAPALRITLQQMGRMVSTMEATGDRLGDATARPGKIVLVVPLGR